VSELHAEDVGEHGCPGPANALHHAYLGPSHLALSGVPGQLEHDLAGLVERSGANGVATGLEAAHRGDGDLAAQADPAFVGKPPALSWRPKSHGFQLQACHDAECIMHLEEIDIVSVDIRLAEGLLGR